MKIYSRIRLIIFMCVINVTSTIVISDNAPRIENKYLLFVLIFFILAGSFYISTLLSMARIRVSLTDQFMEHVWEKRFLLDWEEDLKIPLEDIEGFEYESDRTMDSFVIMLKGKMKYKISTLNYFKVDKEFERLGKDFPKFLNSYLESTTTANTR